jgi:ABC-type molybdate transport system substrate-binding protein
MSIEGLIGGVMMLLASVSSGTVDSKTVWNTAVLIDKASQKRDWSGSMHEESHQAIKDTIRQLGQR